jgi:hypothetical protein
MPYIIEDGYIVFTDGEGGTATITAQDGTEDSFSPEFMTTLSADIASLNVETTLLSGETAVTLVGDSDYSGTLSFVFTDDAAVANARAILRRPTSFALEVPDPPSLNMTFVRSGSLGATIHDTVKDVWEVSVGFREVAA